MIAVAIAKLLGMQSKTFGRAIKVAVTIYCQYSAPPSILQTKYQLRHVALSITIPSQQQFHEN